LVKKSALYVLDHCDLCFSPATQQTLAETFAFQNGPITREQVRDNLDLLSTVEIIFSGWGGPRMDEVFLRAAPKLAAVFYAAGSIRPIVTDAFWKRSIVISSAWAANAIPVAEFTFAHIILALKQAFPVSVEMNRIRASPGTKSIMGAYNADVGIIGLGMIGRQVIERLRTLHVNIWAYDPGLSPEGAAKLGVRMADLDTLFAKCQVVSLHAPNLESTRGMISGAHLNRLPPGGTFINTARGAVVKELEMIDVLKARPDLFAILDVTEPEPPDPDSPLYDLPNVHLTPHIAGSLGHECWRMGDYMLEEVQRYLQGEPLEWQVTPEIFRSMA
jgi:phosphoglycerate dehydrogenase-like enzyme